PNYRRSRHRRARRARRGCGAAARDARCSAGRPAAQPGVAGPCRHVLRRRRVGCHGAGAYAPLSTQLLRGEALMAPGGQRRLRFGVRHTGSTLQGWQDVARKAEDLGFSTLVVQDHVDKQLAPLPALVAAAAVTSTLRLGTVVLNNALRHPAMLAKEAATVDVLTHGRLELGL